MYQKNPKKKSFKPHLLASVGILIFVLATVLILEKQGVTNFHSTKSDSAVSGTEQTSDVPNANTSNTVDYGPANPDDSVVTPDKDLSNQATTPANPDFNITITSTRKNAASTAYLIKVAVVGTDSGSCTVVMSKGSKTFSSSGGIELSAGQYSCMNLEIPLSSLDESGTWNVEVIATDKAGATAYTNTEVIL